MTHYHFLLIGQGISGTFLSHYLLKGGSSCLVIDDRREAAPSRTAAGIINPVTGRRIVKTWMIEDLMPFAWDAYTLLGTALGVACISQKNSIDFFPSAQMHNAFYERLAADDQYLSSISNKEIFRPYFNFDFDAGEINPCYLVDLAALLPAYRKFLFQQNSLLEESFDLTQLVVNDRGIRYKDISADTLIFCDGIESSQHPYFNRLPFAPNKGEALLIRAADIPDTHIYKKGINLVPYRQPGSDKGLFWAGSSYEWNFNNADPSDYFRQKTVAQLKEWLKVPFTVEAHLAAVRPATLERRPFIGLHPLLPQIGIFNGMGTKGCSLAPYFGKQFAQDLLNKTGLNHEVSINRFTKILSRNF
jgi:glycine/D-amino acid oxidase-like deaminating enzyme